MLNNSNCEKNHPHGYENVMVRSLDRFWSVTPILGFTGEPNFHILTTIMRPGLEPVLD